MTTATETSLASPHVMLRREHPHIDWVNKELERVNTEIKALGYTAAFSVLGVCVTTALLYLMRS